MAIGPRREPIPTTPVELCIQALEDSADSLRELLDADALTVEALARIDEAHEKFVLARMTVDPR